MYDIEELICNKISDKKTPALMKRQVLFVCLALFLIFI